MIFIDLEEILHLLRSAVGDAGALTKDACNVCDACVLQEHDGRRAAKRQAEDDRESNS